MRNQGITHHPSDATLEAYYSLPNRAKAAIIVIHEVWGLTPQIQAICKRLVSLDAVAIAPNLYSQEKNLFTTEDIRDAIADVWNLPLSERYNPNKVIPFLTQRRAPPKTFRLIERLYSKTFRTRMLSQLLSWTQYAHSRYHKVATIGLSMGGGLAFKLAARYPLSSCVGVCGEPPSLRDLKKITVPMLAICAGRDDFMNWNIPKFVLDALRERKDLTLKIYGGAKHEFFNNAYKRSYQPSAAADCWNVITTFLRAALS